MRASEVEKMMLVEIPDGPGSQSGSINTDWPCMVCGYNLRGLAASGNCPECNHSASESLRSRPLSRADPRWLNRIQWTFNLLMLALLCEMAVPYSLCEKFAFSKTLQSLTWRGQLVLFKDDIYRIVWPLLLLPVAWLLRKPERPEDRPSWPVRILFAFVLAQLAVILADPIFRLGDPPDWAGRCMVLVKGLQPSFVPVEYWLVLGVALYLSARIATKPMRWELLWFRRVFCALLVLDSTFWVVVNIAMAVRIHRPPPSGQFWLPEPWGSLTSNGETLVHQALMPLWIWLLVVLLRTKITVRHATPAC